MKGLIQRVSEASVSVDGVRISEIEHGLLLFLGVEKHDNVETTKTLCRRVARFRIFPDSHGRMNLNVVDAEGAVLIVPQFTLAADTRSGNRPSFSLAAAPDRAENLYQLFIEEMRNYLDGERVATGQFGADMEVALTNNGPVTFMLEAGE